VVCKTTGQQGYKCTTMTPLSTSIRSKGEEKKVHPERRGERKKGGIIHVHRQDLCASRAKKKKKKKKRKVQRASGGEDEEDKGEHTRQMGGQTEGVMRGKVFFVFI